MDTDTDQTTYSSSEDADVGADGDVDGNADVDADVGAGVDADLHDRARTYAGIGSRADVWGLEKWEGPRMKTLPHMGTAP